MIKIQLYEKYDYAGIDRKTYIHFEEEERDYYPPDKIDAIAELYDIDATCLLDEYNLFLYQDQGKQIRTLREQNGMNAKEFANVLGIDEHKLRKWERNKIRVSKQTWKRLFRGSEK